MQRGRNVELMTQTGKKDSASNQIKTHSIKKALFPL